MDANTSRKRKATCLQQHDDVWHQGQCESLCKVRRFESEAQPCRENSLTPTNRSQNSQNVEEEEEEEIAEFHQLALTTPAKSCTLARTKLESLLLDHIGSFRGDPFKTYPVQSTPVVTQAIDFFSESYGPVAIRLPGDHSSQKHTPFFGTYFRTMLHDPMLFELIVALSLGLQRLYLGAAARLTPEIVQHIQIVLSHLHARLPTTDGTSDVVVLTIIGTLFLNYMMRDFKSFQVHFEGLRRIIKLRGGKDQLGWNGYLRDRATQVEDIWAAAVRDQAKHVDIIRADNAELHYPTHPFHPHLCKQISKLPEGFRELALTTKLSAELIEVLEQLFSVWTQNQGSEKVASGYLPANKVLDAPKITTIERLIAVVLLALCHYVDQNTFGHSNPLHLMRQQAQLELIAADTDIKHCDRDCVEWAAHVLSSTTVASSESQGWAHRILQGRSLSRQRQAVLETLFFPIPRLRSADGVPSTVN